MSTWRERQRAAGKCIYCREDVADGRTMCERHLEAKRQRHRDERDALKQLRELLQPAA